MATRVSEQLRAEVVRRAASRCEYCLIRNENSGFAHQVDHVVSQKHGGASTAENLALACILCNRHKGSDVACLNPDSGEIVRLFHPRRDRWPDHFRIRGQYIMPLTEIGAVTVRLLRLNMAERLAERRLLQSLGAYPVR